MTSASPPFFRYVLLTANEGSVTPVTPPAHPPAAEIPAGLSVSRPFSAGADTDGNGLLTVKSKTGTNLIYAGAAANDTGFLFHGYNKTGEGGVQLSVTTTATAWLVPTTAGARAGRWKVDRVTPPSPRLGHGGGTTARL